MMEPANDLDPEMGEPNAVPDEALDAEDAVPVHIEALPPEMLLIVMTWLKDRNNPNLLRAQRAVNRRWEELFHKCNETNKIPALCRVVNLSRFDFVFLQQRFFLEFNFEQLVKIKLRRNVQVLIEEVLTGYYPGITQLIINERYMSHLQFWTQLTHLSLTSEGMATTTGRDPSALLNGLEALEYLDLNGPFIRYYPNMGPTLARIRHLSASYLPHEVQLYRPESRQCRVSRRNPTGADRIGYENLANFLTPNCTRLWFEVMPVLRINEWQQRNPAWFRAIAHLCFDFFNEAENWQDETLDCITNHMPALELLDVGHSSFDLGSEEVIRNVSRLANLRRLQLEFAVLHDIRPILARGILPWVNVRSIKLIIRAYYAPQDLPGFIDAIADLLPNVAILHVEVYPALRWFRPEHNVRQYVDRWPELLSYCFKCGERSIGAERRQLGDDFVDLP